MMAAEQLEQFDSPEKMAKFLYEKEGQRLMDLPNRKSKPAGMSAP
jgi:hypothetical protein